MTESYLPCKHVSARTAVGSHAPCTRTRANRSSQLASASTGCTQRKHGGRTQRLCLITASSKRQPKDPRKYATMDELRTHLMQQQGTGGFSGFLSWVGSTAFGASRCVLPGEHNVCLCCKGVCIYTAFQQLTPGVTSRLLSCMTDSPFRTILNSPPMQCWWQP